MKSMVASVVRGEKNLNCTLGGTTSERPRNQMAGQEARGMHFIVVETMCCGAKTCAYEYGCCPWLARLESIRNGPISRELAGISRYNSG